MEDKKMKEVAMVEKKSLNKMVKKMKEMFKYCQKRNFWPGVNTYFLSAGSLNGVQVNGVLETEQSHQVATADKYKISVEGNEEFQAAIISCL
jgi:hypothetical protein